MGDMGDINQITGDMGDMRDISQITSGLGTTTDEYIRKGLPLVD
jgi:hypothetical protein